MPLHIVRNDITHMSCDAIINAANPQLRPGGGVCGAIFAASDAPALGKACKALGGCPTGSAVLTDSFGMNCRYIIHAVGPVWQGGTQGEAELLRSAYRSALRLMEEKECRSGAFPLLSAGIYGYPMEEALDIAVETMREHLEHSDMELYLVIYSEKSVLIGKQRFSDIQSFIDDNYVHSHARPRARQREHVLMEAEAAPCCSAPMDARREPGRAGSGLLSLLEKQEESFSQMVLRLIRERGLDEVAVYKAANLDRKLFSRLRSHRDYQPSKATALALAVGLRLSVPETSKLLERAGYALSNSSKQDIIVRYFIQREVYDIMTINEALFDFDQHLLGA